MKKQSLQMLFGSIGLILALFFPVVSITVGYISKSMNGYETDLGFTGLLAIIAFLASFSDGKQGKRYHPFIGFLGLLSCLFVIFMFLRMAALENVSIGISAPLAFISSILISVGGLSILPGTPDNDQLAPKEDEQTPVVEKTSVPIPVKEDPTDYASDKLPTLQKKAVDLSDPTYSRNSNILLLTSHRTV